jgi:hypothetical protein
MKNTLYTLIGLLIGAAGMFGYGFYRNHTAAPQTAAKAPSLPTASETSGLPPVQTTAGNRLIPAAFQGRWLGNYLQSDWQGNDPHNTGLFLLSTPGGAQTYCKNNGLINGMPIGPGATEGAGELNITSAGIEKTLIESTVDIKNLNYTVYTPNHIAGTAEYASYDFSCRKEKGDSFDTLCETKRDTFDLRLEGDTLYITNGYDYIDDESGKRVVGTNTGRFVRHPCPPPSQPASK